MLGVGDIHGFVLARQVFSYQSASSATVAMTDKGRGDTEETLLSASHS